MRRLDRYIFREILVPGLIALVAMTFIVLTKDGGKLVDIIVRQSPTAVEIWTLMAALLPKVLTVAIPMGVLMGILTGFSRLSSDSEIIALRASGLSMRRLLRPVLLFAFMAWTTTSWLSLSVAPKTAANLRAAAADLALKYSTIALKDRSFYEKPNWPVVIWVNGTDKGNGTELRGILLVDTKNPDQPEFTVAESGNLAITNENRSVQLSLANTTKHVLSPS